MSLEHLCSHKVHAPEADCLAYPFSAEFLPAIKIEASQRKYFSKKPFQMAA